MKLVKVTLFGILGLALYVTDASAATCEGLRTFSIRQGTIASTQLVPAGPYVPAPRAGGARAGGGTAQPGGAPPQAARAGGPPPAPVMLPEHCRVKMVLKPSSDSNINAELWLPAAASWNGKFMAVGNGGFGGSIQGYGEMANALALGYATAGNDTGHSDADGPGGMFALGHP